MLYSKMVQLQCFVLALRRSRPPRPAQGPSCVEDNGKGRVQRSEWCNGTLTAIRRTKQQTFLLRTTSYPQQQTVQMTVQHERPVA
jgi:hypothetical protein